MYLQGNFSLVNSVLQEPMMQVVWLDFFFRGLDNYMTNNNTCNYVWYGKRRVITICAAGHKLPVCVGHEDIFFFCSVE